MYLEFQALFFSATRFSIHTARESDSALCATESHERLTPRKRVASERAANFGEPRGRFPGHFRNPRSARPSPTEKIETTRPTRFVSALDSVEKSKPYKRPTAPTEF